MCETHPLLIEGNGVFASPRERQEIVLKWVFAAVGLLVMLSELVLNAVVFWTYASANGWLIPDVVITTYLAATAILSVGLVTVMMRSLFAEAPEPAAPP